MKLQQSKTKEGKTHYFLTIPMALVNAKGWKKGTELKTELDNKGNIIIKEVPQQRDSNQSQKNEQQGTPQ